MMFDQSIKKSKLIWLLLFPLYAGASVEIAPQSTGIEPIAHLAGSVNTNDNNSIFDVQTNQIYNKKDIITELFRKYNKLDNMLVKYERLSGIEKTVVRELTMKKLQLQNQRIEKLKSEANIDALKSELEHKQQMFEVKNDPNFIIRQRKAKEKADEAKRKELYKPTINVDTVNYDPTSNRQIEINNQVNHPSVIAFFDMTGSAYPISSHLPDENAKASDFDLLVKNGNQLLIVPKRNYLEVSGFVWLKNLDQPIPIHITSYPEQEVDVKKNVILPSVSPSNDKKMKEISMPLSKLNTDNDTVMTDILNGRETKYKQLKINGLPANSKAFKYNNYYYFKTQAQMLYEVNSAYSLGDWYVYRAHPKSTYWFNVDNKDTEVKVYE